MTKGIEKSIQETSGAGSKIPNSLRSKERAITKMMMIIFFTFLLTYIPSFVVKWVSYFTAIKEFWSFKTTLFVDKHKAFKNLK